MRLRFPLSIRCFEADVRQWENRDENTHMKDLVEVDEVEFTPTGIRH